MMDKQDIIEHFSMRAVSYDSISAWVKNEKILKRMIQFFPEGDKDYCILDLGAGTGAVSKYILNNYKGNVKITALDFCSSMLEEINDARIQTVEATAEKMPFSDNSFDIVISRQCLHYIENLDETLLEIKRVLRKDGIFILGQIVPFDVITASYWRKIIQIRQPLRKWYYTTEQWDEKLIKNGFRIAQRCGCTHQGSVSKWIAKYNITDQELIDKYEMLLRDADDNYKNVYSVRESNSDILYNAYWYIIQCEIEK